MYDLLKKDLWAYLGMFTDMISGRISKEKITNIDAPDPSGTEGRPRKMWRYTTETGRRGYSKDKPQVGAEAESAEDGEDAGEPKIVSEVDTVRDSLKSGTIAPDAIASKLSEFSNRAMKQMRKIKGDVKPGSDESKTLGEAMGLMQEFSDAKSAAGTDPAKLEAALKKFNTAADKIQEVTHEVNAAKKGEKKPEGAKDQGKPEDKPAGQETPKEEAKDKNAFVYEKAELSTAAWEGKIQEIEKAIGTKTTKRGFPSNSGNKSGVMFDMTEGGAKVVFKPDALEDPVSESRRSLRADVSGSSREMAGFKLDRIFGFGVVPPTFYRESDVSDEDVKNMAKNNPALAKKKGGKMTGSAQAFVRGESFESMAVADESLTLSKLYKGLGDKGKLNLQKMAIFDYISGNTDRHTGNIMVDGDDIYAIDQGRCFPGKDRSQFNSKPLNALSYTKEKIDPRIIKKLQSVDLDQVSKTMREHGMGPESVHVVDRIQDILKSKGEFENLK